MRKMLLCSSLIAGTFLALSPALALNPQPLPPGAHQPQPQPNVKPDEPPDPCRQFHSARAHARCLARHHRHTTGGCQNGCGPGSH
jgi:hypothetical protein